nr:hypothetical protein Cduv_372 [Cedratvirus duvanny]
MEGDKQVPLLENILLYVHCSKKGNIGFPYGRKDFTLSINGKEIRNIPLKNGFSLDTGIQKGDLINDVFVCTGSLKIKAYAFRIRECVDELHLEVKKGKVTLNQKQPILRDCTNCSLM